MKLLLVCSSGGHLLKAYLLKNWWKRYERIWVTRIDSFSESLLSNEVIIPAYFPENRNIYNFIRNFFLAGTFFLRHKPDYIFSTGAGVAIPFFFIAKFLGIKTIFMETFILLDKPTVTGKILYKFSDLFIVQNKKLLKKYPKAIFWGSVL